MFKRKKFLIIFALIQILIFVIYFSSTTDAWLSKGSDSEANVISSSTFDINVFVENEAGDMSDLEVDSTNEHGYLVKLDSKGRYTVTISTSDLSTAKNGYCKIVANKQSCLAQIYYKVVITKGVDNDTLTFTIETLQDDVSLLFIPCLGMSASNSFEANEAYLSINFGN